MDGVVPRSPRPPRGEAPAVFFPVTGGDLDLTRPREDPPEARAEGQKALRDLLALAAAADRDGRHAVAQVLQAQAENLALLLGIRMPE